MFTHTYPDLTLLLLLLSPKESKEKEHLLGAVQSTQSFTHAPSFIPCNSPGRQEPLYPHFIGGKTEAEREVPYPRSMAELGFNPKCVALIPVTQVDWPGSHALWKDPVVNPIL